jgi:hypothetical protein
VGARSALLGRARERAELEERLVGVREGVSSVLVLRGEAGVGKTVLLDDMVRSAEGFEVVRVGGVESEMQLSFASLHALLVPYLGHVDDLPAPQRDALGSAFGLVLGTPADRFLVGLSVLTMFDRMARDRPVCCVVDDAQWLDRESRLALTFVARRLRADHVGLFFSVRTGSRVLADLPEMQVDGLSDEVAARLLESTVAGRLDRRVAKRLVEEARGNPLALVEFARALTDDELAGEARLPERLPLGQRLEAHFRQQVQELPVDVQTLLVIVAAELQGDASVILRAARALEVGADALDAAVTRGILVTEPRLQFRHPLIRSAVYSGSSHARLRRVHEALALAMDGDDVADRRTWHLALAAVGPNEDLAEQLEQSAVGARSRGGYESEAVLMERSAQLSADGFKRSRRLLAATRARLTAGTPAVARRLLEEVRVDDDDIAGHVQMIRLRAAIAVPLGKYQDAGSVLLRTAVELEPLDHELARATMLEAFDVFVVTRHRTVGAGLAQVGR